MLPWQLDFDSHVFGNLDLYLLCFFFLIFTFTFFTSFQHFFVGIDYFWINLKVSECKYMEHIFEMRMKYQIEERSSQLLRNLSSCEKKA